MLHRKEVYRINSEVFGRVLKKKQGNFVIKIDSKVISSLLSLRNELLSRAISKTRLEKIALRNLLAELQQNLPRQQQENTVGNIWSVCFDEQPLSDAPER